MIVKSSFNYLHTLIFSISVSLCLLLGSCSFMQLPLLPESASKEQAEAELLFINGEFEQALQEFAIIHRTAVSPEDQNLALYGIACSQMIMAQNDEQFVAGVNNLLKWDANKGSAPFTENRHLLVLALQHQSDLLIEKNKKIVAKEKKKNWVIASQRKKISQMATTLKKLQHQLEELEAIDETLQGKRKPL